MSSNKYCEECGQHWCSDPSVKNLPWEYNTVRVTEALNKIINNLDQIPIEELEKLGDKYGFR